MSVRMKTLSLIASGTLAVMPFVGLYMAIGARYDDQTLVTVVSEEPARRGSILDRNGEVIAYDEELFEIVLLPSLFYENKEVNSAIERLFEAGGKKLKADTSLPVDKNGKITGNDEETELLKTTLGFDSADGDKLLKRLYGIFGIDKKSKYAYKTAAVRYHAHISGAQSYVLCKAEDDELLRAARALSESMPFIRGRSVFERKYASVAAPHIILSTQEQLSERLSGEDGSRKEVYRVLSQSAQLDESAGKEVKNGEDITLTIDSGYQLKIQSILGSAVKDGKCKGGAICVADCRSGELLACASAPDFDISRYNKDYDELYADPSLPLFDRALSGLYRPGSAMKTITAFAALDKGVIDKDTSIWCGKWYPLGDTTFSCLYYHGFENVETALRDSCNVFFYKCSQMIGQNDLSSYQYGFGLGASVPCGLENESGRVVTPESVNELGIVWSEGLLLQSAIGQSENAVTPIQMVQWAAMLANKGELIPVSVIKGKDYAPTKVYKNDAAFDEIKAGMIMAANNIWGEDSLARLPEKPAIKSGTPETGSGFDSTVIGFYPADDPEIAFSVVLEDSEQSKSLIKGIIEAYL